MSSIKRKLPAAPAGAVAIALATESAPAWGGSYFGGSYAWRPYHAFGYRPYAANFTYRPPYAYRAYYGYRPFVRAAYAAAPWSYGTYSAYNYYPSWTGYYGTGYYGSGTFSDGRRVPGTNYNPNSQ